METVDEDGLTAVHVASERGCIEMCWTLLQRSGFRILHLKTYSGHTPLDLCRQGRTFRWVSIALTFTWVLIRQKTEGQWTKTGTCLIRNLFIFRCKKF